jgi:5-(carboxyamino)imidazole ribonucleotide synthase
MPLPEVIYDSRRFPKEPRPDLTIFGDGQLAYLTGLACRRLGGKDFIIGVVGANPTNSAGEIADVYYRGDITHAEDLAHPLKQARSVTLDTEHVAKLPYSPKFLFPMRMLPFTQNKRTMHGLLKLTGELRMPDFNPHIESLDDLQIALSGFSGKGVLQTGSGAYDGRGNAFIRDESDITKAWERLGNKGNLFLEEMIEVEKELAVQIVRDGTKDGIKIYPPVECNYINGQLYLAESYRWFNPKVAALATTNATIASRILFGKGPITVEFLLGRKANADKSELFINEVCIGRPHNSQHLTEGANVTSQFDQSYRMSQEEPLGDTRLKTGIDYGGMINLLGAKSGGRIIEGTDEVLDKLGKFGLQVFGYGKKIEVGRKVGHVTAVGTSRKRGRSLLFEAVRMLNEFNDNSFIFQPI